MARPNKYLSEVQHRLKEIEEWARTGYTNNNIANALGVTVSTFCDWQNKYPQLVEAVRKGRQKSICEVRAALYKKAIGFEYEETKSYIKRDEDGNKHEYTEKTKKKYPPDTGAIAMWLRNYDKEWHDRDWQTNEFKRLELEIKQKMAEKDLW